MSCTSGPGSREHFNSALLVTPQGEIAGRYDKLHPVMFGEYIPLAKQWSWLARITPIGAGLDAGRQAEAFEVAGVKIAPNICYESTLSHLIRGQVEDLRRRGQEPDLLINQTNDGWFWGSSELDLHLICGVFRAVECRKPFLIAANTGFSAWIDSNGRIVEQGPRHDRRIYPRQTSTGQPVQPLCSLGRLVRRHLPGGLPWTNPHWRETLD